MTARGSWKRHIRVFFVLLMMCFLSGRALAAAYSCLLKCFNIGVNFLFSFVSLPVSVCSSVSRISVRICSCWFSLFFLPLCISVFVFSFSPFLFFSVVCVCVRVCVASLSLCSACVCVLQGITVFIRFAFSPLSTLDEAVIAWRGKKNTNHRVLASFPVIMKHNRVFSTDSLSIFLLSWSDSPFPFL